MKEIKSKPFKNKVTISGEIYAKDDSINYIPFPLAGFDIRSYREQKGSDEEPIYDEIRIIRFNDETVLDDYEIGDRVLIKGEAQSRNYKTTHPLDNDLIQNAVDLYTNFFQEGELPTEKQPTSRIKQPISWDKLFEYNLIDEIPADSVIREDGTRERTEIQMYIYRVDHNGEVFKETEHTAFEVIAHEINKLDEDLDSSTGDQNYIIYHGRISRSPSFDVVEGNQFAKITVQSFVEYFQPEEKRFVFFNFFVWGKNAEIVLAELDEGDMVRLTGRIQSRSIERIIKLKKKNSAGKTKRKKITVNEITREVSIVTMAKIAQKASS
ncbi:single-stranded DNA-binding protein [Priestia aryabhattai]